MLGQRRKHNIGSKARIDTQSQGGLTESAGFAVGQLLSRVAKAVMTLCQLRGNSGSFVIIWI